MTDFLAASGSTLVGAGSAFALTGNYFDYNRAPTPEQADARAIQSDFAMVGADVAAARASFEEEHREELCG